MSLDNIYASIEESDLYQCVNESGNTVYVAAKSAEQATELFKEYVGVKEVHELKLYEADAEILVVL